MRQLGIFAAVSGLAVLVAGQPCLGDETPAATPDFKEVYDLIRENLPGVSEAELNRAAVKGLVTALGPKVTLVTNGAADSSSSKQVSSGPGVLRSNLYDGEIAYVRIGKIADGTSKAVRKSYDQLGGTNKLKGVVLDLRYADGDDYSAAAAIADLFIKKEQPLLKWGSGSAHSSEKSDAIAVPVAALVNRQTRGAAEALAAVLRQTGVGLVLGSQTAGQAMVAKEFPLKNGDRLRIATARIEVAETAMLSPEGLKPDIRVEVSPEDERAYYADAFKVIQRQEFAANSSLSLTNQGNGTNRTTARRPRFNEAELVKERREGATLDGADISSDKDTEPEKPSVHDPTLARSLDLLKGLAVVRHSAS